MRSIAPLLFAALLAIAALAALHDIAVILGRALLPWFGWILP